MSFKHEYMALMADLQNDYNVICSEVDKYKNKHDKENADEAYRHAQGMLYVMRKFRLLVEADSK